MGLLDTLKKDVQEIETNVEPTPQTPPVVETTQEQLTVDRSAYNCPLCGGEGLDGAVICSRCAGTGKI